MLRLLLLALTAGVLFLVSFFPQPAHAQPDQPLDFAEYMLPIENYQLPNGLRVILARDDSAPVVAVNVTYRVGGADDPEGRSGFAHLFEHMMFYGSANVKQGDFDRYLTEIGARFNAYTADDKTVYYATVPANQLPLALWLESDRMASLVVNHEAFDTERQVVIEEYNERVANAAYGFAARRFDTLPFQGYPPYERPTIGNVDDLNAATLGDVQQFHSVYYAPNNATLAIVGDIDIDQTKLLVSAYFARIAPADPVTPALERYPLPDAFPVLRTDEANGCQIGHEEVIIDRRAELPALWASVVTTQAGTDDAFALALLGRILGDGESSRFQQRLVQSGQAAFAFANHNQNKLGASVMQFGVYPKPGDDIAIAYSLLRGLLDDVVDQGVTEAELARAKQQTLLSAITDFRRNVANTAEWLQDYTLRFDDPLVIPAIIARYQDVTVEDIQRVAQTYLCDRPLNLVTILKEGEALPAAHPGPLVDAPPAPADPLSGLPPGVVNRYEAPAPLPAGAIRPPAFVTFTLENGLDVIVVEQNKTPEVNLRLYVGGSDTALPPAKQGVAELLTGLLTKGTATRSADEIAEAIESVGGSLSGQSFSEFTGVFASGPSSDVPLIFELLADVARNPTFPPDQFDLLRDQLLAGMQFDTSNPNTLADRQFRRIAYTAHPYSFHRTPDSVNGLSPDDLRAFHTDYYRPNNALLVIVGDLSAEAARTEANRVFADWEAAEIPNYLDYPRTSRADTPIIYLIDRTDAEQSTLRIGNLALRARSPDRYAFDVANTVLGGSGLASRLNKNLRENKGYTYGVYSGVTRRHDRGTFLVAGDVGVADTGNAINEILRELRQIRRTGVLTDEMEQAKGMLLGQFTMGMADPATLASELASRHLYGLPLTDIAQYPQAIEAITASEVITAARSNIDVRGTIIVVVGDARVVRPQLVDIAQVHLVDVDGALLEVTPQRAPPEPSSGNPRQSNECICAEAPAELEPAFGNGDTSEGGPETANEDVATPEPAQTEDDAPAVEPTPEG